MFKIGVFDHVDKNGLPGTQFYEARLKLIELYDRAGFYAYHCAEHHLAPSGLAPSPNLYLAAIAQRTKRLRFGPLVYQMPTYHPLRLIEEICMLDQMSGGRLELGCGRGSGPAEIQYFGQGYDTAQQVYSDVLDMVLKVLAEGKISFPGAPATFQNLPLQIECVQKPHPPLWYGAHSVAGAHQAAVKQQNIVSLDTAAETRTYVDEFVTTHRQQWGDAPLPMTGISRFVIVGDTDAQALEIARRAYKKWWENFTNTSRIHGYHILHGRPSDFDTMQSQGKGIAGSVDSVVAQIKSEMEISGCNYFVGQFAFGDLTLAEAEASLDLFVRKVVPALEG